MLHNVENILRKRLVLLSTFSIRNTINILRRMDVLETIKYRLSIPGYLLKISQRNLPHPGAFIRYNRGIKVFYFRWRKTLEESWSRWCRGLRRQEFNSALRKRSQSWYVEIMELGMLVSDSEVFTDKDNYLWIWLNSKLAFWAQTQESHWR